MKKGYHDDGPFIRTVLSFDMVIDYLEQDKKHQKLVTTLKKLRCKCAEEVEQKPFSWD